MDNHHAVGLTLLESAVKDIAVFLRQLALAVLQVVLPLTHIHVAVFPTVGSSAVQRALAEMSCIFIAVYVAEYSFSRALSLNVVALIDVAVLELVYALAVLLVVEPVPHIHVAVSISVSALS